MATLGIDSEIILDGTGYFVKPGTYVLHRPRIRKATIRADGGESYVDLGPGKREWVMVILCFNEMVNYDGTAASLDGQGFHAALITSFAKVAQTISYTDPTNTSINVYFDNCVERCIDLHTQIVSISTGGSAKLSYEVAITLVEA